MVGRDGVVNDTAALDGKLSLHKGIVKLPARGRHPCRRVENVANEFEPLRASLIRHEPVLSRKPNNRRLATPAIRSTRGSAEGRCGSAI
jgi:hypothetical protein